MSERLAVRKTYKLFIGGAFPRSESGRSYEVRSKDGKRFLANAALASRKDARDAVVAARKAFPRWSGATAYNRGQILYRIAEMLEGRRAQFVEEVQAAEGLSAAKAQAVVDAAIDRWVWYAGWSDKVAAVRGSSNPVAGPYFDFSVPEPTGVVAVLAPQRSALLGLVSVVAPVIVTGNTAVVLAPTWRPPRPRTSSACCARRPRNRTGRPTPAWTGCSSSWRPRRSGTRSGREVQVADSTAKSATTARWSLPGRSYSRTSMTWNSGETSTWSRWTSGG